MDELGGEESETISSPHFFLMTSGGTEKSLLKTIKATRTPSDHEAIYIIAHPEFNSLPASLEALARLQMDGVLGEIIYFKSPNDRDSQNRIHELVGGSRNQ